MQDRMHMLAVTLGLRWGLQDPAHGVAIRDDLRKGLPALPEWMQTVVRDLRRRTDGAGQLQGKSTPPRRSHGSHFGMKPVLGQT
jgi:hypothetical protein